MGSNYDKTVVSHDDTLCSLLSEGMKFAVTPGSVYKCVRDRLTKEPYASIDDPLGKAFLYFSAIEVELMRVGSWVYATYSIVDLVSKNF